MGFDGDLMKKAADCLELATSRLKPMETEVCEEGGYGSEMMREWVKKDEEEEERGERKGDRRSQVL